jgi:solute carrier family 35 protein
MTPRPTSATDGSGASGGADAAHHAKGLFGLPPALVRSLGVCAFYASTSVGISMLNKALLSSYHFSCYFFMLAAQLLMTLAFCTITRDRLGNPFEIVSYSPATYRASVPMAAAYVANVCLGLLGLQLVNVPVFFAIRRTASAFILLYEYMAMGRVAELNIRGSVGIIVLGALVAGSDSLTADLMGYLITCANNLATAAASVMQKQFSEQSKLPGGMWSIMYYQALTALPACLVLGVATGEVQTLLAFPYLGDAGFWLGFFLVSVMGLLLSYASLLSTTVNSPLATSITGNVKDVVLTVVGAIVFPGFRATVTSVGGLLLSFTGSGIYSYINLNKALAAHSKAAPGAGSGAAGNGAGAGVGAGASAVPMTPSVLPVGSPVADRQPLMSDVEDGGVDASSALGDKSVRLHGLSGGASEGEEGGSGGAGSGSVRARAARA